MRTSFHHQPEAQHPIFQLSTSWQADYPIFRREADNASALALLASVAFDPSGHQARPQSFRTTRAGFDHRWFLLDHSELRPLPIGNSARDLCRRLVGDREYRTDVDLAKHVAVGPVGAGRAEHEVRVPDHR